MQKYARIELKRRNKKVENSLHLFFFKDKLQNIIGINT